MKKLALVFLFLIAGCASPERSKKALDDLGFTGIKVGGYAWFGCGDDSFHTEFTAINANGKKVEGVVCCGWMKNCTVRF